MDMRTPPQGLPPSYAFVNRVYGRRSLRPVVASLAIFGAIFSLLWAIGSFRELTFDNQQHVHKLSAFALVMGILYMVVFAIELIGCIACGTQRLSLIRLYAYGSFLGALIVVAVGVMRVVAHFILKNALIQECTAVNTGDEVIYTFGIWGPTSTTTLSASDAASWCQREWNKDSWSEIILLLLIILFSAFFTYLSFAYLYQSLDPSSAANAVSRRGGGFVPDHYIPPLAYDVPAEGESLPQYKPPSGPPPSDLKPPGYGTGPDYDAQGRFFGTDKEVDIGKSGDGDPFADFEPVPGRRGPNA